MPVTDNSSGSSIDTTDPEQWVDEYGDFLYEFALFRVRDPKTAEVLLQKTLSAGLAARDKIQQRISEKAWLIGILRRKIIEHFRIVDCQQPIEPLFMEDSCVQECFSNNGRWLEKPAPWPAALSKIARQKSFAHAFHMCLKEMPGHLRQVFVLRELEGFEIERICSVLNNSEANIRVMLYQARLRLWRCLGEKCFGDKQAKDSN